jgi:hypothetical protein
MKKALVVILAAAMIPAVGQAVEAQGRHSIAPTA